MGRRTSRYVFFILAIATGVAFGIVLGWAFNPLNTVNTGLENLRIDYQIDYVLMISQLYQSEGDIATALARLSTIGDDVPSDLMQIAINYATQHDYAPADINAIQNLAEDVVQLLPTLD